MAQRGDEFWIEIQDIRHCVEDEGDTLTLLWMLEGRAELNTDAGRDTGGQYPCHHKPSSALAVHERNGKCHPARNPFRALGRPALQ